MTWITSTSQPVVQRRWGQECVLYDVDSGNTHLVTPLAAEVLLRLQDQPSSTDCLTLHFAASQAITALPAIREALVTILDDLERIGLVCRHSP